MIQALLCGLLLTKGGVKIDPIDFLGWKNALRMSNGVVELVYVPQVGRVMRYAMVGGENLLWVNPKLAGKDLASAKQGGWANYGGDKLWPAPQSKWNWPPDPTIDGSPYQAQVSGDSILITGPISTQSGLQFSRRITMDSVGTTVHFKNTMMNTASTPQKLAVWQIVQIDNPDFVQVPLEATPKMPNGWAAYDNVVLEAPTVSASEGTLTVKRSSNRGFKLGSASQEGWLRASKGSVSFAISLKKVAGEYVDDGKFLQVYANGDPDKYMELEVTGPLTLLAPGKSCALETDWEIVSVSKH